MGPNTKETPQLVALSAPTTVGMDRRIERHPWHWSKWPLGARVGAGIALAIILALATVAIVLGSAERSVRIAVNRVTIEEVEEGVFHDFVPLRGKVVPHDTIYIDADRKSVV